MSDIIKAIYERKMSDAKDLIDEALFRKLAEALVEAKDSKKKLDPVGQEDGDIDNDGDEDETDSYLANRRKAIGKAMKKEDMQYEEKMKKLDSRPLGVKRQSGLGKPTKKKKTNESVNEGAPGHDHEHQSAFDHSETEAKEKSLRKVKMRAKGGSY